jgi:hypothetical protein
MTSPNDLLFEVIEVVLTWMIISATPRRSFAGTSSDHILHLAGKYVTANYS